jgi:hypothetical protein
MAYLTASAFRSSVPPFRSLLASFHMAKDNITKDQFLVIIMIIKLILLKVRVRTVKFQIYEWQRATGSGAEGYESICIGVNCQN